jgi:hypothetical protein
MYIETKMMLPVKTITEHAHNLYQMSSNLRSIAYDLHYCPGSKNYVAFFYPNMPIFMTDQNDTYLSHYPNATHHTTSDTNMSFIEINTKKTIQIPYPQHFLNSTSDSEWVHLAWGIFGHVSIFVYCLFGVSTLSNQRRDFISSRPIKLIPYHLK